MHQSDIRSIIIQEFTGALLLFIISFPVCFVLGDTYFGWAYHFISMVLHEFIAGDVCVNPSVAVALYAGGLMKAKEAYVRALCDMAAGSVAYFIIAAVTPSYAPIEGPHMSTDVVSASFIEIILTFILMFFILISSTKPVVAVFGRPIVFIACGVRLLMFLEGGKYTGPSMNPMIAFSYAVYKCPGSDLELTQMEVLRMSLDWLAVYIVAPTVGAVWAVKLYQAVRTENSTESCTANVKDDTKRSKDHKKK